MTDWEGTEFQWDPSTANKPSGCCMVRQDGETMADAEKEVSVKKIRVKSFTVVDGEGLRVKLKPKPLQFFLFFLDLQKSSSRP